MAILKYQTCGTCGAQQELPAIFCGACGGPLIKISKIFLTFFLTLTVAAFVIYGLKADAWLWPGPLYGYYAVLFVLYSFAVTRRYTLVTLRMVAWCSILAYAMWFFWLSVGRAITNLTSDISDILDMVVSDPIPRYIFIAAIVLELIFAFVILKRKFGFFNGYRVYVTLLAAASYCAYWAYSKSTGDTRAALVSPKLSDWFLWAPDTEVKELFELLSVNLLRVVVAEMAVFSFVKSVKPASDAYQKIALQKAQGPAGASAAMLDAVSRVSATILRSALLFRFFLTEFVHTCGSYLYALYRTLRRITIDLGIPALSLAAAACILGMLAEHTAAYITGKPGMRLVFFGPIKSSAAMIPICLVMIYIVQMIFLAAVTKFSFRALARCNTLLMLWLAPFVLALFVFVSLSLAATGSILHRWDKDFPFRIGPMTIASIVILVGLVIFSLLHSKRAHAKSQSAASPQPETPKESE